MSITASLIEKVLRFYPPAQILYRTAAHYCVVLGFRTPQHTVFSMIMFAAHCENSYYENSQTFVLDRFAASRSSEDKPFTPIISFLECGRNACLASALAGVSAETTIVTPLRFYAFALKHNRSRQILHPTPVRPKSGSGF